MCEIEYRVIHGIVTLVKSAPVAFHKIGLYSWVSNTRGGSNKRVDWNYFLNLISGEALITARRVEKIFICVGEKIKKLEIFLNINKRGGSNNSG